MTDMSLERGKGERAGLRFRAAVCVLGFALRFNSPLLEHIFERIPCVADVFSQQVTGRANIALAA